MSTSNADKISEAQSNLPKPEDPPVASDFNSSDPKPVSSAGVTPHVGTDDASSAGLRGPATKGADMDMSKIGG